MRTLVVAPSHNTICALNQISIAFHMAIVAVDLVVVSDDHQLITKDLCVVDSNHLASLCDDAHCW